MSPPVSIRGLHEIILLPFEVLEPPHGPEQATRAWIHPGATRLEDFALPGPSAYTMRAAEVMQPDSPEPEAENLASEAETDRRQFLERAVRQDPDDTFARYGLAMELAKTEPETAWTHFEYLLTRHPGYSATYFQAGMFLLNQGRRDEARKVLTAGVEVTSREGKQHAQHELQAALDNLESNL
jgi:tetratricopeptide (TPR) repeat protein